MPPPIDLAASFDSLDIMKKVMRQRLGDASSSIYLWHFPLIVLSVALGFGALSVVVIFGVGVVSYRYVEAPLQGGSQAIFHCAASGASLKDDIDVDWTLPSFMAT